MTPHSRAATTAFHTSLARGTLDDGRAVAVSRGDARQSASSPCNSGPRLLMSIRFENWRIG